MYGTQPWAPCTRVTFGVKSCLPARASVPPLEPLCGPLCSLRMKWESKVSSTCTSGAFLPN